MLSAQFAAATESNVFIIAALVSFVPQEVMKSSGWDSLFLRQGSKWILLLFHGRLMINNTLAQASRKRTANWMGTCLWHKWRSSYKPIDGEKPSLVKGFCFPCFVNALLNYLSFDNIPYSFTINYPLFAQSVWSECMCGGRIRISVRSFRDETSVFQ